MGIKNEHSKEEFFPGRGTVAFIRSNNKNEMRKVLADVQDVISGAYRDYDSARTDLLAILNDSLAKLSGIHMVNLNNYECLPIVEQAKHQCRHDFYSFLDDLKLLQERNQPLPKEAE